MFKSKKFSLLMALVFAFTVVFPVGAAFAAEDNTSISGSYNYVKADDKKAAGTVRVKKDGWETETDAVVIQLRLPEGVEFSDDSVAESNYTDWINFGADTSGYEVIEASSSYFEVRINDVTNVGSNEALVAEFDFGVKKDIDNDGTDELVSYLDIDDDFTGNLDVTVDVIGIDTDVSPEKIVWTDNDDVTIAKVSEGDVTVTTGDTKKVSVGRDKEVADIILEESMAGAFAANEVITLKIETDGVEFSSVTPDPIRLTVDDTKQDVDLDGDGNADVDLGRQKDSDGDYTIYKIQVTGQSQSLPGKLKLDKILLDIAPDVSGEIEISVTSNNEDGADLDETVTVAIVGDVTAEVAEIDDNDTVAYAGQDTELDVEFTLKTTDGSNFSEGDMIIFELNKGKFATTPKVDGSIDDVKLYSDDEAFYYTFPDGIDTDEITVSDISVVLNNDAEPGDLTLTITGDYGDLGEVVIGQVAKPFTITADKPAILAEALGQEAGDIYITETDDGAFVKDQYIYVELPSGIELSKKPSIEVTEGSADATIEDYDDDYFVIKITEESSSEPSTLRVYDLKYDTGKLALVGDVELEFRGDIDEELPATDAGDGVGPDEDKKVYQDGKDWEFEDESVFAVVANATVVDESVVTATFTLGDEGVAIQNSRMLVQVNTLCDVLGLQKSWDAANKVAYFVKNGTVVAFPIDQNKIIINGNEIPVDQGGTIINGFTYATLRGIQMAFGGELSWDNVTKTAAFEFQK